jgi:oligoribonuclease NrnB/cAMP/cGMP phosphodiesterase (DHH superfamily)
MRRCEALDQGPVRPPNRAGPFTCGLSSAYNGRVTAPSENRFVHIVTHGPHCLDGVTAAVVVSRYRRAARVLPYFSSNAKINETLLGLRCEPAHAEHEVWITDISWTDEEVDRHLQALADRGVRIYWIDHHRTALERVRSGGVHVRLTAKVLSEEYAAARLVYQYVSEQVERSGQPDGAVAALERLVAMADDNDRWLHRLPGSRRLALAVGAMQDTEAYTELCRIDSQVTLTPALVAAARRAEARIGHSFEVAEHSRSERQIGAAGLRLVTAVCDGYPSEIADRWGRQSRNTVFAFFDTQSLGVSLRRSPDCAVDLSQLAWRLGGGGHPAAAGSDLPDLRNRIADLLAALVGGVLEGDLPCGGY